MLAVALLLWNAWHVDYPTNVQNQTHLVDVASQQSNASPSPLLQLQNVSKISNDKLIQVHTDVLDVAINPITGNLIDVKLLKYFQEKDTKKAYQFIKS